MRHAILKRVRIRSAHGPAPRIRVKKAGSFSRPSRIERIVVLDDHPSLDSGEVTDKGSINQRALLAARAHLVAELYGETPSDRVIGARG